jgi:hypothetical protein
MGSFFGFGALTTGDEEKNLTCKLTVVRVAPDLPSTARPPSDFVDLRSADNQI